ncbi:MAG TPA: tetratricopeptide repeat protein [Gemmataceae bacterium]|nr:tetratricopeptide repeat protein [Gemmataceae bacterium]
MKAWSMRLAATLRRPLWLVVLLVFCAAAAVGGWFLWNWRKTDDLRRQALAAMADRDFETAKGHLQAYLAARPKDGEARFLLARAFRQARTEDFDQAGDNLYEARRLGYSGDDAALEAVLLDIQEHGPSAERMTLLQPCLEGGGAGEALGLEAMARGCIRQIRMAEAIGLCNRWVELAPDDWYPRLWRGALYEYMNQASLAAVDFDFVRQKRPADEAIRVRTGLMLSLSGLDYNRALSYLEPYRRDHPEDMDVVVAVARCQRMQQHFAEAEALLKPIVAAHPDAVDALLTLALVESDRGDDQAALGLLQRLEPLVRRSHSAAPLARLRRLEPVVDRVDAPKRSKDVFTLFGTVLSRLGRTEEAKLYLAEADKIDKLSQELTIALDDYHRKPQDVAVMEKVGTLSLRVGMVEEGAGVLERLLQMKPDDLAAHQALAEYYGSSDDPELRRLAEPHRRFLGTAAPSAVLQGPGAP